LQYQWPLAKRRWFYYQARNNPPIGWYQCPLERWPGKKSPKVSYSEI
jgi:hypothetical protein